MLRYRFDTWVLCALAFSCLPLQVQAQTAPVAAQRMDTTHAVNVAGGTKAWTAAHAGAAHDQGLSDVGARH